MVDVQSILVWPRASFFPTSPPGGDLDGPEGADDDDARALAEAWRARCCLDEARFAERLASEGHDARSFGRLLAARASSAPEGPPAAWQKALAEVFEHWNALAGDAAPCACDGPFTSALHPFIAHGLRAIHRARPSARGVSLDAPELSAALYRELARRLDVACRRVLVLELNVARVEERLEGDTPEARFESYCRSLSRPEGWATLLAEYQVTARAIGTIVASFATSVVELLVRLAADIDDLRAEGLVGPGELRLVGARGGLSDPHRGGRSVWILAFATREGAETRLVYKPRSLSVDQCFQRFLAWVDARVDDGSLRLRGAPFPRFRALRMLARPRHGWAEVVPHEPCASTDEVARFYQRQGGLLAILHVLRGVDLHAENIIACGEQPMLIDLEALLHRDEPVAPSEQAALVALDRLFDSVIRVGLLPNHVFGDAGDVGANISALGDGAEQTAPFLGARWEHTGTDEMGLVLRRGALPAAENVPRLGDAPVPVTAHTGDVEAGFTAMIGLLAARREELCAPGGPIDAFADVEVRHVVRATQTYGTILTDAAHPDCQRDAVDLEALLDVLWLLDRNKTSLPRLIPSERADLREGDVPVFVTRPGSRDLWDSRGSRVEGYFATDGITEVKRRLSALSDEDLRFQTWLVRASLSTLAPAHRQAPSSIPRAPSAPRVDVEAQRASLSAEAARIGDRLLGAVIEGARDVTWIGVGLAGRDQWALSPVGLDLYDGTAGIGVFLASLGRVTGEARFSDMALRIAEALVAAGERRAEEPIRTGGFLGDAAELYAILCMSRSLDAPALLARALRRLDRFAGSAANPGRSDVIDGDAGTALALLAVHAATGSEAARGGAIARAEALCERAEEGFSSLWPEGQPSLLGFSHGAAGIAAALLGVAGVAGQHPSSARMRALAGALIDHERRCFDPARRNWPRLQPGAASLPASAGVDLLAWCHGAPGVALGRVLTQPIVDDAETRREIKIGIETTLDRGLGKSHILCHGDLGALMIARRAAEALDRVDVRARVAWHTGRILTELRERGPVFGTSLDNASPGLLCGLAGIGHGLLYQARPDVVPMVLGLEAPQGYP